MNASIIIGGEVVQYLSGPTSYRLLKPKPDVFEHFHELGVDLPIFLLFGDHHHSYDKMCSIPNSFYESEKNKSMFYGEDVETQEPCSKAKGCYRIYDKEFLGLLDKMAKNSHYPVDFYAEHFDREELYIATHGPIETFINRTVRCYGPDNYYCDYPHLRWHYADIRRDSQLIESSSKFCNVLKSQQRRHPTYLDLVDLREYVDNHDDIKNILMLLRFNLSGKIDIRRFYQQLFEMLNAQEPKEKLIKQIERQTFPQPISYWAEVCYQTSLAANKNVYDRFHQDDWPIKEYHNKLITELFKKDRIEMNEMYKIVLPQILYLHTLVMAVFMDLYTVLRSFKTPRPAEPASAYQRSNPSLVVAYFGDGHCRQITELLTNQFGWYDEPFYYHATDDLNRCLQLSPTLHIPLDDYLRAHDQKRSRHTRMTGQKTKNRYKKYLR